TGQVNAHVSGTVTIGGISVSVASDGVGGDSGDATKTFVNSRIQIPPASAFNQIGTDHTLTGHGDCDTVNGSGFGPALAGTVISFSITNGPGSFDGPSQCAT